MASSNNPKCCDRFMLRVVGESFSLGLSEMWNPKGRGGFNHIIGRVRPAR